MVALVVVKVSLCAWFIASRISVFRRIIIIVGTVGIGHTVLIKGIGGAVAVLPGAIRHQDNINPVAVGIIEIPCSVIFIASGRSGIAVCLSGRAAAIGFSGRAASLCGRSFRGTSGIGTSAAGS